MQSNILDDNLKALREVFPGFTEKLEDAVKTATKDSSEIIIEKTKNGAVNFRIIKDGKSVLLHSAYDPVKEAERWLENSNIAQQDTIAVLGIGAAYHIDVLVSRYPNKNKIIIEPNIGLFMELLQNRDITKIIKAKNIQFIINDDVNELGQHFSMLRINGLIDNIIFLDLPSYERVYSEWWNNFKLEFMKHINMYKINVNTVLFYKKEWYENYIKNIKEFYKSIPYDKFENSFKNIPAVIVSAGPSLNKNIEQLKALKDKAVIIACGSAINILENKEITPHAMIGIDPEAGATKMFREVKSKNIYFLNNLTLHYEAVREYSGPKLYLNTENNLAAKWFEDYVGCSVKGTTVGTSVSNIAVDIARIWGCNPIILVGQDLAFTNMQSYAEGAVNKEKVDSALMAKTFDPKGANNIVLKKDLNGEPIYTDQVMLAIKVYLEEFFKANKETTFINCTEGGIPLDGVTNRKLSDTIQEYCQNSIDIVAIFENKYTEEIAKSSSRIEKIKDFLNKINDETIIMRDLAIKRITLLYEISKAKKFDEKKWDKVIKLTDKIESYDTFQKLIVPNSHVFMQSLKNENERNAELVNNAEEKRKILIEGLLKQYAYILDMLTVITEVFQEK